MGVTEAVSEIVAGATFAQLPAEVVAVLKRIVLDGCAVAVAGSQLEEAPKIAAGYAEKFGGPPCSSVFGFGSQVSPPLAAFVNGISMHVLDYEPMWYPPTHPTSPLLPAVFALAEWQKKSGAEFLTALAVGFELQGRLRVAMADALDSLKFHPPGTVGVLGAAAASARLLGLDAKQTRHAIGIAASRAGGVMVNIGSMTKATHCGNSARMGVESALLAADGFTANEAALESPRGFFDAFCGDAGKAEGLTAHFGDPYRLVDPGIAIKLFPSQYGTHYGITAALDLAAQMTGASGQGSTTAGKGVGAVSHELGVAGQGLGDHEAIESVRITAPQMRYVDRPFPTRGLEGKFSLQYTVASALLDGKVDLASFTDAMRNRPAMEAMLRKIELRTDPSMTADFANMHVTVEVTLRSTNGRGDSQTASRTLSARCACPRGRWGTKIDERDLQRKALECLVFALSPDESQRCIETISRLETAAAPEVASLAGLLSRPPVPVSR